MNKHKNKYKNILLLVLMFLILFLVLFFIFKDSYKQIIKELSNVNPFAVILMLVFGYLFYFFDAVILHKILITYNNKITLRDSVKIVFASFFSGVVTLGAGSKPASAFFISKKRIEYGKGFSITCVPYVFHKVAVMIYATIILLFNYGFIFKTYSENTKYLVTGYVFTVVIVIVLALAFVSKRFHKLIFFILEKIAKIIKREDKCSALRDQITKLQETSVEILVNKKMWFYYMIVDMIKLTCWYVLPFVAYAGIRNEVTVEMLIMVISTAAFMQLIIGVIPSTGGMISTEIVFIMLFSCIFGKSLAGSILVLYRLSNYYFPFIVGALYFISMENKKDKLYPFVKNN